MLQERLYLIEERDGIWLLRLDPLDRTISGHTSEEMAVEAAMKSVRNQAPCRVQVRHSGQPVSEWYIRYPDGAWQSVPPSTPPKRPRTVVSAKRKAHA